MTVHGEENACAEPLPDDRLLAYLQRRLAADAEAGVEAHYFACGACAARLEALAALRAAVVGLVDRGGVSAAATEALLAAAAVRGRQVRRYRLRPGETVACTAAPEDAFVAVWLGVEPLAGEEVDLVAEITELASGASIVQRSDGVPVDRAAGGVVYLYAGEAIRALPRSRFRIEAELRGPSGVRRVGPFVLDHTPWQQLPGPA